MIMDRKDSLCRRDLLLLLGSAALATLAPAQTKNAAKKTTTTPAATPAAAKVVVRATLDNLQAAYNGESNASARYALFAKKADEEGYGKLASLFRAAAKSEGIHAENHAVVIKKMGGKPGTVNGWQLEKWVPAAKSTRENLEEAIKGETYEFKSMYPAFLAKARAERNTAAIRTFNYARQVEAGHAKLYQEALDHLAAWKAPNQNFFVCSVCGNTVAVIDFKKCPVCDTPKEDYVAVK